MPKSRSSRLNRHALADRHGYWEMAKRPLQILVFLLPLILAYEAALTFLLQSSENVRTVLAHKYLLRFFDAFNVAPQGGLHLGGIAIVVVLLVWHVLNRDPWRINLPTAGFMAIETIIVTIPLLGLAQIAKTPLTGRAILTSADSADRFESLGLVSQWAISVGAGLYEELVFRMILIAVVHTLLVDVGKATHEVGAIIAIIVSAAAFTWYHPLPSASVAMFYFLAGLYFGAVYVLRGFGIAAGVHALYDIVTFSMLSQGSNS
jgi:membrane protease YdiL (CAAX protease family)